MSADLKRFLASTDPRDVETARAALIWARGRDSMEAQERTARFTAVQRRLASRVDATDYPHAQ